MLPDRRCLAADLRELVVELGGCGRQFDVWMQRVGHCIPVVDDRLIVQHLRRSIQKRVDTSRAAQPKLELGSRRYETVLGEVDNFSHRRVATSWTGPRSIITGRGGAGRVELGLRHWIRSDALSMTQAEQIDTDFLARFRLSHRAAMVVRTCRGVRLHSLRF